MFHVRWFVALLFALPLSLANHGFNHIFIHRGGNVPIESSSLSTDSKFIVPVRLPQGTLKTVAVTRAQKASILHDQLLKIASKNSALQGKPELLVSVELNMTHQAVSDVPLSRWKDSEMDITALGITKDCKIVLHGEKYQEWVASVKAMKKDNESNKAKSKKRDDLKQEQSPERIRIVRQKASKRKVVLAQPLEALLRDVHSKGRVLALIGKQRVQHTAASRAAERKRKYREKMRLSGSSALEADEHQPKQLLEVYGAVDLQLPSSFVLHNSDDVSVIIDKLKQLQSGICDELGFQVVGLASSSKSSWNPQVFRMTAAATLALGRDASSFIHLSVVDAKREGEETEDSGRRKKSGKRKLSIGADEDMTSSQFTVEPFHLSDQALKLCSSGALPLSSSPHIVGNVAGVVDGDGERNEDYLKLAEGRSVIVAGRVAEEINCYLLAVTLPILSTKSSKITDLLSLFPTPDLAGQDPAAILFLKKLVRNLLGLGKDKDRMDTLARMRDFYLLQYLKNMLSASAFGSLVDLVRCDAMRNDDMDEDKEEKALLKRQSEWRPSPQLVMELDALRLSLEAEDAADEL